MTELVTNNIDIFSLAGRDRQQYLQRYVSIGNFTNQELGLNPRYQSGIILPDVSVVWQWAENPHANLGAGYDSNDVVYWRSREAIGAGIIGARELLATVPVKEYQFLLQGQGYSLLRRIADRRISTTPGIVPDQLEDFNHATTELSNAISGYTDRLVSARFALALFIADANNPQPLATMDRSTLEQAVSSFIAQHKPRFLGRLYEYSNDEIHNTLLTVAHTIAQMKQGNIDFGLQVMKESPEIFPIIGTYICALLKVGLASHIFATEEEIKNFLVTFAKSEHAPQHILPRSFGEQRDFSGTLNVSLDMGIREIAPEAFAFANVAILEQLGMVHSDYLHRIYASNQNMHTMSFGLDSLERAITRDELKLGQLDRTRFLPIHKSVFTALAEAIDIHKIEFYSLLRQMNYPLPDTDQTQYGIDVDHIALFNKLCEIWQSSDGHEKLSEIEHLMKKIYASVQKTPDLVRATAFIPDEDMEDVVTEVLRKGTIPIQLITNYYDQQRGSIFQLITLGSSDAEEQTKLSQLCDDLDLPENASFTQILQRFYQRYQGQYPYTAIHIFPTGTITTEHIQSPTSQHIVAQTEIRLALQSYIEEFWEARLPFKGKNSSHVIPLS